ncbi:cadherin-related family member 3 [Hyla sarda]|uniref:cadherin-related family member 3 n=1 Tax=Hyla sarda TaxID=327740 RepID=UPI0024C4538B|nr:cadherin-related family member 3 [Hyla sarda]
MGKDKDMVEFIGDSLRFILHHYAFRFNNSWYQQVQHIKPCFLRPFTTLILTHYLEAMSGPEYFQRDGVLVAMTLGDAECTLVAPALPIGRNEFRSRGVAELSWVGPCDAGKRRSRNIRSSEDWTALERPGEGTLLFIGLPNMTTLAENSPAGTVVYTFSVNITSSFLLTPRIINSNPLSSAFRIDTSPPNYLVVTTGNPILDYETIPSSFDIQIYMEDAAMATKLETLTVQLTNVNEPPVFLDNLANQVVTIYIEEGAPQGDIYTILASDPEDPTSDLKFALTPTLAPFKVSTTGVIQSTKIFDYETDPHSYSLTVEVMDSGGLTVNGSLVVMITNINDETPYFTMSTTTFTIPEEQNPGTIVTTITAVDPDDVGFISTLYYSIDTPNQYFSINKLTGVIQIAMRIDIDVDTLHLNSSMFLKIKVSDLPSAGHSNYTTITINVQDINDNPPVCTTYAFSTTVPETEANGSLIMDLTDQCKDIDVDPINKAFNFTGLSGLGSNERFQLIPAGSGNIVLTGNLDFEDPNNIGVGNEYSLTIEVKDIAFPNYKKNIYVYIKTTPVNEYPPVFNRSSYVFNVSELSPPGSPIGYIHATDKDYPYIGITYSLESGGSTLGATGIFWINPTSGVLVLSDYADYETTQQYTLTVRATDSGSLSSTAPVTVNILEANDEIPICLPNSYTLYVPTNQASGTNIQNFKLTCTDRDSPPTSFQYIINSGNINNHFAFSPSSGTNVTSLILALPFDYSDGGDTTWNYNLRVLITDDNLMADSPQPKGIVQTGTVSLFINVYVPGLTTTPKTTTTPSVVYVVTSKNVYSPLAWYIPFVSTIGALLLLGFLGFLIYLLAKYCPCKGRTKPDTEPLIKPTEKKIKQDVFWEMTKLNTVFDGEAVDPITGNVYEYNSKSGARRWKDTKQPVSPVPVSHQLPVNPVEQTQVPVLSSGTPNKKVKTPISTVKAEEATVPGTPSKLQTPKPTTTNMESEVKSPLSRSPLSPIHSPKVSPKIPKTPA